MSSSEKSSRDIILPITIEEWFRSHRFDELNKYLDVTEEYLQKAKTDFEIDSDERVESLPAEKRQEFYDFYTDDYWQYAKKFPRILRNSFLVSAISLLEYEISVICDRLKKEYDIRISLSDLRGDTLEQTKKYIKNAGLDITSNNPVWQEINNYYMVRNCIAHNNGLIKGVKDERALRDYIFPKKIISEDTLKEEIALTPEFCKEVIETIQNFLVELEKKMAKMT